jgi:hypothetical protein
VQRLRKYKQEGFSLQQISDKILKDSFSQGKKTPKDNLTLMIIDLQQYLAPSQPLLSPFCQYSPNNFMT